MTISVCAICANPTRLKAVELLAQGGMTQADIARVIEGGYSTAVVTKHLKEPKRVIVVEAKPMRERVLALQEMQLDEFERRVRLAKDRASRLNKAHDDLVASGMQVEGEWVEHDWSEFFDIWDKDNQAAINSILKAQGLTDKREAKSDDLKLGLFEAMARAGLAPKTISGGTPALPSGEDADD